MDRAIRVSQRKRKNDQGRARLFLIELEWARGRTDEQRMSDPDLQCATAYAVGRYAMGKPHKSHRK